MNSHDEVTAGHGSEADEQRTAQRVALLIRSAKVICEQGEFLCIIRDASETGVKLRLFHQLPACPSYELCLANGDRFTIAPVWENGGLAGFQFGTSVDLQRILVERSPHPKRPVRLALNAPAAITANGQSSSVTILNLSREGMRIECTSPLAQGADLRPGAAERPVFRGTGDNGGTPAASAGTCEGNAARHQRKPARLTVKPVGTSSRRRSCNSAFR